MWGYVCSNKLTHGRCPLCRLSIHAVDEDAIDGNYGEDGQRITGTMVVDKITDTQVTRGRRQDRPDGMTVTNTM